MKINQLLLAVLTLFVLGTTANAQVLYVGANYHPHDDKNIDKIKTDIRLMKEAGFTCVRLGHLAWAGLANEHGQDADQGDAAGNDGLALVRFQGHPQQASDQCYDAGPRGRLSKPAPDNAAGKLVQ